jgi:hypothetical protein
MKIFKNKFATLLLAATAFFAVSCDDNDEIKVDPNAEFDAVLEVKEAGPANPNADVIVDANTASTILAKVSFTSTTKSMTRLYITKNVKGQGEEIYEPTENIDLKGDGAVDLTGKNDKAFEFQFTLPVTAGVGTGTVVYKFWTTDGNGDFRDQAKRLAVGPGTITLKYGTATNPAVGTAPVNSYSAKILAAPLLDGTSLTFISLLDGVIYKIKDGAEFAKLWDFGYYYTTQQGASLASTSAYEASFANTTTGETFVDVDGIAGTTDLNKAYFSLSTKTSADFDAVAKAEDLNFITPATTQKISGLTAGNIVAFVDQYGKKGLIRVVEVKGTTGATDYIKIDIKVQP